jgi:hypothetical protein
MQAFPSADEHPLFYVAGYALIGFVAIVLELFASVVLILGTYRASRILFGQLLRSVVGAQMRWHDTNPTGKSKPLGLWIHSHAFAGRTLNRLSKGSTFPLKTANRFVDEIFARL